MSVCVLSVVNYEVWQHQMECKVRSALLTAWEDWSDSRNIFTTLHKFWYITFTSLILPYQCHFSRIPQTPRKGVCGIQCMRESFFSHIYFYSASHDVSEWMCAMLSSVWFKVQYTAVSHVTWTIPLMGICPPQLLLYWHDTLAAASSFWLPVCVCVQCGMDGKDGDSMEERKHTVMNNIMAICALKCF